MRRLLLPFPTLYGMNGRARYPQHSHKFRVLWNGYDPDEDLFALPLPLRQKHVMVHAGNLYWGRDPGSILRGLDRLLTGWPH